MNGILGWKALTQYGVLLCLFGFFGPEFDLWGKPVYVWALRAGFLLFVGGLVMGAVLAATGRLAKGSADHHAQGGGRRHRFTHDSIGAGSAVAHISRSRTAHSPRQGPCSGVWWAVVGSHALAMLFLLHVMVTSVCS